MSTWPIGCAWPTTLPGVFSASWPIGVARALRSVRFSRFVLEKYQAISPMTMRTTKVAT